MDQAGGIKAPNVSSFMVVYIWYSLIITIVYDTMQNSHYSGEEGQGGKSPGKQEDRVQEVGGERVGSRVLRELEAEEKCKMVILTIPSQT